MKKYKKLFWGLIIIAPLAMGITSCKKYLDRQPLTATLEDLNQGKLEAQILTMYSTLRGYAGYATLPWLDFNSIRDDDAQKGSSLTDGAEINTEFETFVYTKDDWATDTYWNDHYFMINLANNALDQAKTDNLTDAASLRNVGEACFFRAHAYFELVKAYGDVPLRLKRIIVAADGNVPKSPAATVYAQIDSDLAVAAKYLPINASAYGNGYTGRLTSGAANTLWAQTNLFRKNWAKVVSLCNQVIASSQYSLTPNFSDIWKDQVGSSPGGKNGPESIWEMQATDGQNAQANSSLDFGTDWGTCQSVRQGGASNTWNLGWGWNTPTDNLVTAWDPIDPRKARTILYSGQSDGGTATGGFGATLPNYDPLGANGSIERKYWNKKIYTGNDPAMRTYTGYINANGSARWIDHRLLRYADVLLMLAEASNEMGDGTTAAANLELIRNRASGNLGTGRAVVPTIAFVNQAQMRTAIKNERRFEFAMEGYRFYDLVRWTPASDGIDATSVLGSLGYQPKNALYPIPQPAINLSGGVLVQNPNY